MTGLPEAVELWLLRIPPPLHPLPASIPVFNFNLYLEQQAVTKFGILKKLRMLVFLLSLKVSFRAK